MRQWRRSSADFVPLLSERQPAGCDREAWRGGHGENVLADGWHMETHAAAPIVTAFAYSYARKHASTARYRFGTRKVGALGGFASAVGLAMIAIFVAARASAR